MPNVLDPQPMRGFARRAGLKIEDAAVRRRFERLAFEQLLADPRNFRTATAADLDTAPDWAHRAAARGDVLTVFRLSRSAAARLHFFARQLAATCELAAQHTGKHRQDAAMIIAARWFLTKIERTSFDIATAKARRFARALADLPDERDYEQVCKPAMVSCAFGRCWTRITSVAELRAVGREFRNCLRHVTRDASYALDLQIGAAQFWVLRDSAGKGLIAAMAPAPIATCFVDVRGPGNAPIRADHADLMRLAAAIGVNPEDPPPPPVAPALARPRRRSLDCTPRDPPLPLAAPAP